MNLTNGIEVTEIDLLYFIGGRHRGFDSRGGNRSSENDETATKGSQMFLDSMIPNFTHLQSPLVHSDRDWDLVDFCYLFTRCLPVSE